MLPSPRVLKASKACGLWPVGGLRVGILSKDVDACATKQCVIARVEGARKALT